MEEREEARRFKIRQIQSYDETIAQNNPVIKSHTKFIVGSTVAAFAVVMGASYFGYVMDVDQGVIDTIAKGIAATCGPAIGYAAVKMHPYVKAKKEAKKEKKRLEKELAEEEKGKTL